MEKGTSLYQSIVATGRKKLALLIDPDKHKSVNQLDLSANSGIDYIFIGGSLLSKGSLHRCVEEVKKASPLPVILFPGSVEQIDPMADGILFLSLISGRNSDNLIGKHVQAAPILKRTNLEVIPTGYMLIDGGKITTAAYISSTLPIPADKPDIAACTALAGEMLGLKLIYMDTGSGALKHVPVNMIKEVKKNLNIPLIVGGGIRTPEEAYTVASAGADMLVIGTIAEESPELVSQIAKAVHYEPAKTRL